MAASEQLKWTWDWPHRPGGVGSRVREREKSCITIPPPASWDKGTQPETTACQDICASAHLLVVTRGLGNREGVGRVEEGSGLRWRRDKVEQREKRATQQVEGETWVVTDYSVAQDRSSVEGVFAGGGEGRGGLWKFGDAALMHLVRNSTWKMQHDEIKRRHWWLPKRPDRRRSSERNHGQWCWKEGVEGWNGGKGATWATEDRTRKKICVFQKSHRITHQSNGKQQSTAARLIRRNQLVGSSRQWFSARTINCDDKSKSMEMFQWTEKAKGTIHVSYKWRWGCLGWGGVISCI